MYNVLIVEDELLVRLGLKNSIEWGKYEMSVVADVANGEEAWEVFNREKLDLIITDIRMPVMDGMEFIRKIREKDGSIKVVILSCVEDFETARKAISLNISDYIPKLTMSRQDIEAILSKIYEKLKKEKSDNRSNRDDNGTVNASKEMYLKKLIFDGGQNADVGTDDVLHIKTKLNVDRIVVAIMEIVKAGGESQNSTISYSIAADMVKEIIEARGFGEVIHETWKRWILLLSPEKVSSGDLSVSEAQKTIGQIRNLIESRLDMILTVGISGPGNSNQLKQLYQEALQSLQLKFFFGINRDFTWQNNDQKQYMSGIRDRIEVLKNFIFKSDLLNPFQKERIRLQLEEILEMPTEINMELTKLFFQLMYWHSLIISELDMELSGLLAEYQGKMLQCEVMDDLLTIYKEYLSVMKNYAHTKINLINEDIVKAVKYIEENCRVDLSLQQVAENVRLSPNYMSSLFKKELGMSYVEYLTNTRIKKAKELLLGTNLRLYEISIQVGYADEAYFSRMFKKTTGKSPLAFRRHYMIKPEEENSE